jgi:hypothetical protein
MRMQTRTPVIVLYCGDEQALAEGRRVLGRSLERAKAEYDWYTAGGRKEPTVIDILIVSGGGDWGAFD